MMLKKFERVLQECQEYAATFALMDFSDSATRSTVNPSETLWTVT